MDLARQLTTCLLSVLVSCGSVRISFSDRTPEKVLMHAQFLTNVLYCIALIISLVFHQQVSYIIAKELGNNPKVNIWDGLGKY